MSQRVCIIGAGSSGLVAAKVLAERGIPFDCFELGSRAGGLWRFGNDNGRSPAYASLRTNTSRDRTGYACFPMPRGDDPFPRHDELCAYFDAFVDRFRLDGAITYRTEVTRVSEAAEPDSRAAYDVTVRRLESAAEETRSYRTVIVASGHHWDPSWPDFPGAGDGSFDGVEMHSFDYRGPEEPAPLAGRRVLVVGIGNSACDIACELAGVASRTLLSTRAGAHVLPKYLFGRPLDHWITPAISYLHPRAQAAVFAALLRVARGDQRRSGVPRPHHRLGQEHPTISQDLLRHVREGRIVVRPDISRLERGRVTFADGSEEPIDTVIHATGYHVTFPFFDAGFLPGVEDGGGVAGNRLRLYLHVVPPERPNLYFLGLIQPLGAIPPLAEAQAEWVADLIEGRAELPTTRELEARIDETERRLWARFVPSARHTLEVDFFPYRRAIARERRRGRTRGGSLPRR